SPVFRWRDAGAPLQSAVEIVLRSVAADRSTCCSRPCLSLSQGLDMFNRTVTEYCGISSSVSLFQPQSATENLIPFSPRCRDLLSHQGNHHTLDPQLSRRDQVRVKRVLRFQVGP